MACCFQAHEGVDVGGPEAPAWFPCADISVITKKKRIGQKMEGGYKILSVAIQSAHPGQLEHQWSPQLQSTEG